MASQLELLPVELQAAGHVPGALSRRIRHAIEARLGKALTAGAVQYVLADPGLLLLIDGASEADADARAALSADLHGDAAARFTGRLADMDLARWPVPACRSCG